jgi:hypothetical protein
MSTFTNIHGQEPTPPIEAYPPMEFASPRHEKAGFNRYLEQAGLLGLDLEKCQAPTRKVRGYSGMLSCDKPAVVVAVENNPRPEGHIGAYALCADCRDMLLRMHGQDYAKMTPLVNPP